MARYIKEGISEEASFDADMKVRKIVEDILDDIRNRGWTIFAIAETKLCESYPFVSITGTQKVSG